MLVKIRCCFLILSSSARAASAFLLSSFSSQPLESLQPNQKRQRAPFPVRLPALVRAKRLLPLFFVQLQRPGPWVISPSGYAAKNAASPARLMPVRPTRALTLFSIVQLHRPTPRDISHFGYAAKICRFAKPSYACRSWAADYAFLVTNKPVWLVSILRAHNVFRGRRCIASNGL